VASLTTYLKRFSLWFALILVLVTVTLNFTYCKRLPSYGSSEQTWAEKLGYPSGKKVIIIHADDAGLSNSVNHAVQDSLLLYCRVARLPLGLGSTSKTGIGFVG